MQEKLEKNLFLQKETNLSPTQENLQKRRQCMTMIMHLFKLLVSKWIRTQGHKDLQESCKKRNVNEAKKNNVNSISWLHKIFRKNLDSFQRNFSLSKKTYFVTTYMKKKVFSNKFKMPFQRIQAFPDRTEHISKRVGTYFFRQVSTTNEILNSRKCDNYVPQ